VEQPSFHGYIQNVLEHEQEPQKNPSGPFPLLDVFTTIKEEDKINSFPFDLLFHLVHSQKRELWISHDELGLDVGIGLSLLTRGLDEEGVKHFINIINAKAAAQEFLTVDLFSDL
jgi:hypothetical protein